MLSELKWLYPGMNIKRWLCFLPIGLFCIFFGTVFLVNWRIDPYLRKLGQFCFLSFGINVGEPLQLTIIGSFFILIGIIIIYIIIRNILSNVVWTITGKKTNVADQVFSKRCLVNGPRIVVIGGGTGLSTMLKGLKEYTSNLTAIVTVTDNGGSSGKLKEEMGVLPPGDIRNCLVALADKEDILEPLLQYRFDESLKQHSFGNLMLCALTNIKGDFESAISELSDILAIRGRVYPCSDSPIDLIAQFEDEVKITGETQIVKYGKPIQEMFLSNKAKAPIKAIEAIENADAIVLGPGSLWTSVIPNLLVKDIKEAVKKSKVKKIYVCNVMTEPGETDNYNAYDHFSHVRAYLDNTNIDYFIVNNSKPSEEILEKYKGSKQDFVQYDPKNYKYVSTKIIADDFMQKSDLARHDFKKLAKRIIDIIINER